MRARERGDLLGAVAHLAYLPLPAARPPICRPIRGKLGLQSGPNYTLAALWRERAITAQDCAAAEAQRTLTVGHSREENT